MKKPEEDLGPEVNMLLEQFIRECPMPTATDIIRWQKAHPAHAKIIRTFAGDVISTTILGGGSLAPPSSAVE